MVKVSILHLIQVAVDECAENTLTALLFYLAHAGFGAEARLEARRAIDTAHPEVRAWWIHTCNCDGHLN